MAQLVEQRIRNAQVVGSSPTISSKGFLSEALIYAGFGRFFDFRIEKNQDRKIKNIHPNSAVKKVISPQISRDEIF